MVTRNYHYFKPAEFERAQPACSIEQMDDWFLQHLDRARELAHTPFVINSAYRSKEYEIAHGRSGTSAHTMGLAVDIRCNSSRERFRILKGLVEAGFSRIGIHSNYIHVDDSFTHDDDVVWLYYDDVPDYPMRKPCVKGEPLGSFTK